MVLLKMLMEIAPPPQDGRFVGDEDDDDFPLRWGGSSPGGIAPPEGKSAPAQVTPRDGGAPSRKSSLHFFLCQNDLYTRRRAPKVGLGGHNPLGSAWAPWRAQVDCACWGTQYFKILPTITQDLLCDA